MTRSLQNIFDTVAEHLLIQNEKSVFGDVCAYRGEDGRRCAIGVLIPDEYYVESIEDSTVFNEAVDGHLTNVLKANGIDINDDYTIKLLRELQRVHDTNEIRDWPNELCQVAKRYGLNAAAIEEFNDDT